MNCDKFFICHRAFLAAITAGVEPRNFQEAMKDAGWRDAMQRELTTLEDNDTWVIENLPPGKRALGCKWM